MSFNENLYNEIKAGTNIITGDEFKEILYCISQVASDMVVKTLGPSGKTTLLDDGNFTYPTKDGYNVLNRLFFNDPVYNSLYSTLKQVSFNIVSRVGDGTTTALVGANAFLKRLIDFQENNDIRQADLLTTISKIKNEIIEELKNGGELMTISTDNNFEDIYRIASVSSNDNTKLAEIIRTIYTLTQNPNIYVTLDNSDSLSYEIQNGYKIDCKTLNHKAYINDADGTFKSKEKVYTAIFDHNLTYNDHADLISQLSRYVGSKNGQLILFAPHFDDIISNVIGNSINDMLKHNQMPNITMIQIPASMDIHRKYIGDLILLTNSQVFDYGKVRALRTMVHNQSHPEEEQIVDPLLEVEGYRFESPTDLIEKCLGYTLNITIAEKFVLIQDYDRVVNENMLSATIQEAKKLFDDTKEKAIKSTSVLNKEYMDAYQRYTKLVGKMGVIKVGGSSELEKHCLKDSVDDSVLACKSAYDNGYVKGLNISLLRSIKKIVDKYDVIDINRSIASLFYSTFKEVSLLVIRNKYPDDDKLREIEIYDDNDQIDKYGEIAELNNIQIINNCVEYNMCYDLTTDTCTESNFNIINSVTTDIEILNAIDSILSLILTSNQFLSVNRSHDRKVSRQRAISLMAEEKAIVAKEIVKTIMDMDEFKVYNIFDKIKAIFKRK